MVHKYTRGGSVPADRDQIALVFMSLAFRRGFRRASVEDVARALHISKKTIYEAFPSKEALLEYALELAALERRGNVEACITETTALGRALQVVRIALADARGGFAESPGVELIDPEMQAGVNDRVYRPMVRDLLEAGVAADAFNIDDVEMTSRFIQAIGMEAARQIHDHPESHPEEATVEAVRRMIVGGVGAAVGADGLGAAAAEAAAEGAAARRPTPVKKNKKKSKKKRRG
jgi:AcrR family transcriptional regulator